MLTDPDSFDGKDLLPLCLLFCPEGYIDLANPDYVAATFLYGWIFLYPVDDLLEDDHP